MKKKLSLSELKVESFVTSENKQSEMGGVQTPLCTDSLPTNCCTGYTYGTCQNTNIVCVETTVTNTVKDTSPVTCFITMSIESTCNVSGNLCN